MTAPIASASGSRPVPGSPSTTTTDSTSSPTRAGTGASASTIALVRSSRRRSLGRDAIVLALLAVLLLALVAATLAVGDSLIPLGDVVRVLAGERVPGASFSVLEVRLPRALGALLAGVAFGVSGAIFQTMLRNALASPDVIGINSGASAAAVLSIAFGASGPSIAGAAFVGALVAALAIWLLAYRRGLSGLRFVLVGIAVGAVLQAVVAYALTRAQVAQAQQAVVWMSGSLSRSLWDTVTPGLVVLAVLLPFTFLASRSLPVLRLGDDLATTLGARPQRAMLALILVAVALSAVATAVTGPIVFVAFLACPIAVRLVRSHALTLPASAIVGAIIVLAADLVGQHALGVALPVGVVTGVVGAPVLLWLLTTGRTRL